MDGSEFNTELIKRIEDAMMAHVQRAILAHIKKYGSYIVDCASTDPSSHIARSFMALDTKLIERFNINIVGVIYDGACIDILILPSERIRKQLPAGVGNGYWRLRIDHPSASDGRLWYTDAKQMNGWKSITCSTLDRTLPIDQLEKVEAVINTIGK